MNEARVGDAAHPARSLVIGIAIAVTAFLPGVVARLSGWSHDPLTDSLISGIAILAAGFMLSWAAEAAESYASQGLILAGVAIITVLPEYAVDIYYALEAGRSPESGYAAYAAANMTGANRILIGLAWPVVVLLSWWRNRETVIRLEPENRIEIGVLALASFYAFAILAKDSIGMRDTLVLAALFVFYLWRVARQGPRPQFACASGRDGADDDDDDDEVGLNAVIASLPPRSRFLLMAVLGIVSAAVILLVAEPFAESMVRLGRAIHVDEFLLIQWVAPLVSEAPEFVIAVLFVLAARAGAALIAMIADKINQWTLLVSMLPLAMSVGAGSLVSLPLDARQHEEFFLTAAQSLFALSLLLRLRLSVTGAAVLLAMFVAQIAVSFALRDHEAANISALTSFAWVYIGLAIAVILFTCVDAARRWRTFGETEPRRRG